MLVGNVILVWDDGPLGWDSYILRRAIDDVADGVRVGYTLTGPFHDLNLDDERTVAIWLSEQGMTPTGDVPRGEPDTSEVSADVVF